MGEGPGRCPDHGRDGVRVITRTYYPILVRLVSDRHHVLRVLGYSDTRVMPPDLETVDDSTEIVIGKPVQMLGP